MKNTPKKRTKNKRFTHIKFPLEGIVKPITHDDGMFEELSYLWSKIGDDINANSTPVSLKKNTLVVTVSSSPWIQQLQFEKSEIIDYLNGSIGEKIITDIKFRLG